MMERPHAPLCRVLRGQPTRVDPQLQCSEQADSCYSSSSEESHPTLSRESSDARSSDSSLSHLHLAIDGGLLHGVDSPTTPTTTRGAPPAHAVEFASNCGYTQQQLAYVLNKIGFDAGQDRILSELVQLGPGAVSDAKATTTLPPVVTASPSSLRSIVIDGSNIAMTHGHKEVFSCAGIRECVRFFTERGHKDVLVFVPRFRQEAPRSDCPITDQHILGELDEQKNIVYTPSRNVNGKRIVCHDDRYILQTAEEKDAVIVSNDEYRDLVREKPQYRQLVANRLLMYSFVDGRFMPPDDPLGRYGPKLDVFLSKTQPVHGGQLCPYARKCTYGNKCKYYHPERQNGAHMSVTERLVKEMNHKKAISARTSVPYEASQHAAVLRTQSLNASLEALSMHDVQMNPYQSRRHMELAAPWHSTVVRNNSMPLTSQQSPLAPPMPQGPPPPPSAASQTHLYAPSTAVWGHSELSVGPLSTNMPVEEREDASRARLQYYLCQLFPREVVGAVMAAHPNETNPQALCERIIAMSNGFHRH